MKKTFLALCGFMLMTAPALAEKRHCYTPDEIEAEMLLRLHSELMVITVTCTQGSKGEDLVPLYTGFTRANLPMLHNAEQTMVSFYRAYYGDNGIAWLDKLRTRLGNDYGQKIATMSAPEFCGQYRDKVAAVSKDSPDEVRQEARNMIRVAEPEFGICTTTPNVTTTAASHIAK